MAYVITDNCVSCGTCAANCPAEAIDMGDDKYVIDQDKCVSCGTCKENCPGRRHRRGVIAKTRAAKAALFITNFARREQRPGVFVYGEATGIMYSHKI